MGRSTVKAGIKIDGGRGGGATTMEAREIAIYASLGDMGARNQRGIIRPGPANVEFTFSASRL